MKYSKIFIMSLILFLLCGCDVDYYLEINDDEIREVSTAWFYNDEIIDDDVGITVKKLSSKYFINDDHLIANETNILNADEKSGYQKINHYFLQDVNELSALNLCYEDVNIIYTDKKIGFSTSDKFLCYNTYDELDKVTVHIYSKYKSIENNADEVINNNYYWYIDKNSTDKQITAIFERKKFLISEINMFLFMATGIIIIICVVFILKKRSNNNQL